MAKKILCFVLLAALGLAAVLLLANRTPGGGGAQSLDIWGTGAGDSSGEDASGAAGQSAAGQSAPGTAAEGTFAPDGYSAVWVSYLEWEQMDFSSEQAFTADVSRLLTNCANLGVKTVIVQVRPFGDALYKSAYFPYSHVMLGTQGADPGFDPLAVVVTGAHAAGLRVEAWVNPYRVRLNAQKPPELAADNPAVLWQADPATAGYVHEVDEGLYYDPGVPAVRELIENGVRELVQNYELDGIQFDDYFYPTTDESFDADTYAQYGGGLSLAEWRRGNVNTLVREVYALIKAEKPACTFGISPSGNIANNTEQQYSDVAAWLSQAGYVDYLMPQIYWGFGYTSASGSGEFAFENCLAEWAALERAPSVSLYVGLGAYRIGDGDGSDATKAEWNSGENLARMVRALGGKAQGFALYRYDFLYNNTAWPDLAQRELAALQLVLAG